jgi:hypothetical protein
VTPDERVTVQELLDAEEAFRFAPALHNQSRLARARRKVEELLKPTTADR